MPNKPKPPSPPKKIVSVVCRASAKCEGRKQKLVWKKPLPSGGFNIRYECLTCKKVWFISL